MTQERNESDSAKVLDLKHQSLDLLDKLGHLDGLLIADKTRPPNAMSQFRCVTCWYYPNQMPCWHLPPYRLNPKLTIVEWREHASSYLDWHDHLHTYHLLFAIKQPKPSVIIIAPNVRELAAAERKLGQAFASKLEDL